MPYAAAEHAPGAVTIVELPAERLPERVERAAYRFVVDCLREMAGAPARTVSIAVRQVGRDVIVELTCDRAATGEWPPAYLGDRVAAVDGQLHRTADHDRQRLTAILPGPPV